MHEDGLTVTAPTFMWVKVGTQRLPDEKKAALCFTLRAI